MPERIPKGYFQWRCRRGTKELDVILTRFLEAHFDALTNEELVEFKKFLDVQDTELWYWLSSQKQAHDKFHQSWVERILSS